MRSLKFFVSALLIGLLTYGIPSLASASPRLAPISDLDSKLPSTDGSIQSLADYRGSVVLVHFFASWCGQCLLEAPSLERLYRSLKDDDFVVVGIAIDDTIPAARSLKERLNLSFPVLVDTERALKRTFSVRGVPMSIILDSSGSIVSFDDPATGTRTTRIVGTRAWDSAAARKSIRELLSPSVNADIALFGDSKAVAF